MLASEICRHSSSFSWTYKSLDLKQRQIAESGGGKILLSELSPVITLGRQSDKTDLLMNLGFYKKIGIEIYQTDRGGRATWHGPGQWVLFIVERLENLTGDSRGVRKGISILLEIAQKVGARYFEKTELRFGGETGVWSESGKFASVGIKVKNGVLLHGVSINGYKTPLSFLGIKPCGLGAPLSYLLENNQEEPFLNLGHEILDETNRVLLSRGKVIKRQSNPSLYWRVAQRESIPLTRGRS